MDEMTQQNAALVEEAASASESMKDQAQSLKQQVTFFNLGQEISPPPKKRKKKNAPQNRSPLPSSHHNDDDDGWEDF